MRTVQIRDGEGQGDMPTTQAVMRSLSIAAIKGGTLAQRTYLYYAHLEDERYRQERQESFDFWRKHAAAARASIDAAVQRGQSPPEWLPHPDDIELNYATLEVIFTGAFDDDSKTKQDRLVAIRDITLSLSFFQGEASYRSDDGTQYVGAWLLLYAIAEDGLPKRLRLTDAEFMDRGFRLFGMLRKNWLLEIKDQATKLGWATAGLSAPSRPVMFPAESFFAEREELRLRHVVNAFSD